MPPWQQDTSYCKSAGGIYADGWTSDTVFCMSGAVSFWQTCLYIALAFWGFFTVLQLFTAFDIQHGHGHALARAMQHLMRQIIIFFIACGSFFMLLLAHQLVWLLSNSLVGGGLPQWRVDALWGKQYGWQVADDARNSVAIPCSNPLNCISDIINWFSGSNQPGQNQDFGFTWSAIWYALGYVEDTILQAVGSIRFLVMLLLVGSAPLAIVASGFDHFKRAVFFRWLELWLELEGLAILSALAIAGFNHVICPATGSALGPNASVCVIDTTHKPDGMREQQYAYLLLGFAGIICGLQLGYIWRFIGQLITIGTNMYQQDYNRIVSSAKAAANVPGFLGDVGGIILGGIGVVTGQPELIAAGAAVAGIGNAVSSTAQAGMSTIPQANGYGGGTMASLPDSSQIMAGIDSISIGSGGGGGDGGGGGGGGITPVGGTPPQLGTPFANTRQGLHIGRVTIGKPPNSALTANQMQEIMLRYANNGANQLPPPPAQNGSTTP